MVLCAGCQRRQEPAPTPTTDQWRRVQESLLDALPEGATPVDATFGDGAVRLRGWSVAPSPFEVGGRGAITFYWEALRPLDTRWRIFVHLDQDPGRQNLDHEAIGGVYPSVYWEPGKIIEDRVELTLATGIGPGDVEVWVGLFRDSPPAGSNGRMPVDSPGTGTIGDDGRLRVGTFETRWEPPTYAIRWTSDAITIDGRPTDRAWNSAARLELTSPGEDDSTSWAKALWSSDALYLLLNARDTDVWATIATPDGGLDAEDVFRVYLQAADGPVTELTVNALGTLQDAIWAPDATVEAAVAGSVEGVEVHGYVAGNLEDRNARDRSWSVELRVPLDSIPGLPAPDARADASLRLNVVRVDRPVDSEMKLETWSGAVDDTAPAAARFGVATLQPPPAEVAAPTEGSAPATVP